MWIKLKTANLHPLFPKALLKHVARMQHSGIRGWRGAELPGLRYAPSGLRCFGSPEFGSGRINQWEKCDIEGNGSEDKGDC